MGLIQYYLQCGYVRNFALNILEFKLKYKIRFSTFQICLVCILKCLQCIPDSCKQFTYHQTKHLNKQLLTK